MLYYGQGDRGSNQHALHQVITFVKLFLRAGEFIRNQEVINVELAIHESLGGG